MRLLRLWCRSLARRPWLPASCAGSVALGIALVTSTRLADAGLRTSHDRYLRALGGGAHLTVRRAGGALGGADLAAIERLDGVAGAVPLVTADAGVADASAADQPGAGTLRLFGVDPLREGALGRFLPGGLAGLDPAQLRAWAARPDGVLAARPCAEALGLQTGSTLRVGTARGVRTLVVRGVVDVPEAVRPYAGRWMFLEIGVAQHLFDRAGRYDRIDVRLAEGVREGAARRAITDALDGAVVEAPEESSRGAWAAIRGFRSGLTLVGALSLAVAAYLVGGTLAYLSSERAREIGILRTLGARRRSVFFLLIQEGALLGAVGSAAGTALGWALGRWVLGLLQTAYSVSVVRIEDATLDTSDPVWLAAAALGPAVAALASVLPAWFATRREGTELSPFAPASGGRFPSALLGIPGLLLLGACLALYLRPGLVPRFAGHAMVVLFTLAMGGVIPTATHALLRFLRRALPGGGRALLPRLAVDGLLAAPLRTSMTVLVLSLTVGMTVGSAVAVGGLRETIGLWLETFRGEQVMADTAESATNLRSVRTQPEEVFTRLASVRGVRAVVPFRYVFLPYRNTEVLVVAFSVAAIPHAPRMALVEGTPEGARDALRTGEAIVASDNFCRTFGAGVGDTVTLGTPAGPRPFRIVARAIEYSWPMGVLYMDRERYASLWSDRGADGAVLHAVPGSSLDKIKADVSTALGGAYPIRLSTWNEYHAALLRQIDEFATVQYAQTLLAGVLGLFAIFLALAISARSRAREFALLRACGLDRARLARLAAWEGALLMGLGTLLGIGTGQLAHLPAVVITLQRAGYTFEYAFPGRAVLLAVAAGACAAALAAAGPIRRTLRLSVGRTLAPE